MQRTLVAAADPLAREGPAPSALTVQFSALASLLTADSPTSGLTAEELRAVHSYENSHRQRRTILGKIEQLAG